MGCSTSIIKPTDNGHPVTQSRRFHADQKKIVLRNWKFLSSDLTGRGSRIFLRIFLMHPHVKALFPCRHLEGDELMKNAHFKGHASRFMQAVGAVVDNIDNYERALSPLLNGLGRKHIHFAGFKPSYFDAFEEAIMYIWAEDLGPRFDEETSQAWHQVFQFIMKELKCGFKQALSDHHMTQADVAKVNRVPSPASVVSSNQNEGLSEAVTNTTYGLNNRYSPTPTPTPNKSPIETPNSVKRMEMGPKHLSVNEP